MTSLYMVGAFIVIIGALVGVVIWISKSSGKSIAERNALKEGESRKDKFDEETSRPVARGFALLNRLRDMGR
jgi:hypothetical protein